MICPICGFDMQDEKTCEKCGWVAEEKQETVEQPVENTDSVEKDAETIEGLDVDLKEVEVAEEAQETEDEFASTEEDLVIDFDEIDNNAEIPVQKSNNWMVSIVSFLAGVLATLIAVGIFNGTIVKQFDKLANGTPYDVVESFCDVYLLTTNDADKMVDSFSPYLRAQIVGQLEYYEQMNSTDSTLSGINFDIDVNDDKAFKEIAKYYLKLASKGSNQDVKITNLEFTGVEYYKSGSDEFEAYLSEYKAGAEELANVDNISIFANVNFNLTYEAITTEQPEVDATPETTKKSKKNKNVEETTVPETTQAPTTNKETSEMQCSAICVKIDGEWYVFNGMQVLNQ